MDNYSLIVKKLSLQSVYRRFQGSQFIFMDKDTA